MVGHSVDKFGSLRAVRKHLQADGPNFGPKRPGTRRNRAGQNPIRWRPTRGEQTYFGTRRNSEARAAANFKTGALNRSDIASMNAPTVGPNMGQIQKRPITD